MRFAGVVARSPRVIVSRLTWATALLLYTKVGFAFPAASLNIGMRFDWCGVVSASSTARNSRDAFVCIQRHSVGTKSLNAAQHTNAPLPPNSSSHVFLALAKIHLAGAEGCVALVEAL